MRSTQYALSPNGIDSWYPSNIFLLVDSGEAKQFLCNNCCFNMAFAFHTLSPEYFLLQKFLTATHRLVLELDEMDREGYCIHFQNDAKTCITLNLLVKSQITCFVAQCP